MRTPFLFIALIATFFLFIETGTVSAAGPEGFKVLSVSQSSTDNGPRVNLTTIHTAFSTENDRVLVYDGSGDMVNSSDWRQATDFVNDTWLFDVGADDDVQLAIIFTKEKDRLIAKLFDDQDGDGKISYRVTEGQVEVTESRWPAITINAGDGWWIKDEKVNFNLDIAVDGMPDVLTKQPGYIAAQFKRDGIIDFNYSVRDYDSDGFPELQWMNMFYPGSRTDAATRTEINGANLKRLPTEGYIFFPHIRSNPLAYDLYTQSLAPIWIDWKTGKIFMIAEFVPSRWGGNSWFIAAFAPLEGKQPYLLDFENPFTFYDLANKNDGFPDLSIRVQYWPANTPYWEGGLIPKYINNIRYSWDAEHDNSWDYALHLVGRHQINSSVELPEFSVQSIPYNDVPYWVTERKWDAANLVVSESGGYWSSEGVYVGGLGNAELYVAGRTSESVADDTGSSVPSGFRYEYNFEYQSQPSLYYSPIDNRLHLKGAVYGRWNIDGANYLEYMDLNGDGYFDQWKLAGGWLEQERASDKEESLVYTGDHLIYSGKDKVYIAEAQLGTHSFQTLPPRNSDEWSSLGQRVKESGLPLSPYSFSSVFESLSLSPLAIDGASIANVHITNKGFSGELNLRDNFFSNSPLPMVDGAVAGPGKYLITAESALTIRPALPPKLEILASEIEVEPAVIRENDFVDLALRITNTGTLTAQNILVSFYAEKVDRERQLIDRKFETVVGGGTVESKITWMPQEPGEWQINASIQYSDSSIGSDALTVADNKSQDATKQVLVSSSAKYGWYTILDLSSQGMGYVVLIILGVIVVLAAGAGLVFLKR